MSHHFGFGNIQVDKVASPYVTNKATKLEASGKFKEKLMLKQRQIEEMMMENRLKKLLNEEERLRKQTELAQKHAAFADKVSDRRNNDFNNKTNFLNEVEENRQRMVQRSNAARKGNANEIYAQKMNVY